MPFYSFEFIINFTKTTALWFTNFEFNASFFYIVRAIGYWLVEFNLVSYYGSISVITIPIIILLIIKSRKHKTSAQDIIATMLFTLSLYYFLATTVHPWYVVTLLFLSVFTRYKFVLVWSFTVMLSYIAYSHSNYSENLWIVAIEYMLVYGVFIWEVLLKKTFKI